MEFLPGTILFQLTIEECRVAGRKGGLRAGHSRRLRQASQPPVLPAPEPESETPREAIEKLDAQFPWLRGVERRKPGQQAVYRG
jgi:hypothetical protein